MKCEMLVRHPGYWAFGSRTAEGRLALRLGLARENTGWVERNFSLNGLWVLEAGVLKVSMSKLSSR